MKGILFKPDMIKAIVEERKTVTRRVIKPQPIKKCVTQLGGFYAFDEDGKTYDVEVEFRTPRYQVGETVYIKEKITRKYNDPSMGCDYATYALDLTPVMFYLSLNRFVWRWQKNYLSPLHLSLEAARYFIQITDVRAERLQEITEEDCLKEGIEPRTPLELKKWGQKYKANYCRLWNSINKDYPWETNPWVWRYQFELANRMPEE